MKIFSITNPTIPWSSKSVNPFISFCKKEFPHGVSIESLKSKKIIWDFQRFSQKLEGFDNGLRGHSKFKDRTGVVLKPRNLKEVSGYCWEGSSKFRMRILQLKRNSTNLTYSSIWYWTKHTFFTFPATQNWYQHFYSQQSLAAWVFLSDNSFTRNHHSEQRLEILIRNNFGPL